MTAVSSDVATIEAAPTPSTLMEHGLVRGKMRHVTAKYTCASLPTASTIRICRLYAGDRVLLNSYLFTEDLLTTNTLAVGDDDSVTAADPDRYMEAATAAAADVLQFNDFVTCVDKVPYTIQETCWLTCLTSGEATGSIQFEIDIVENMS